MPMSKSIADLRALSDQDLIREHDETAKSTVVGTSYYVEELARRESKRNADSVLQNTIAVKNLTWAINRPDRGERHPRRDHGGTRLAALCSHLALVSD
jgi:hypothetical protein